MSRKEKITITYKEFCLAEGNQHIASEFAVLKLQELLERFDVKSILEVGLGIGSIAGSLLEVNKELSYTGTEDNDFCLKALKQNLRQHYKRLKMYSGIADIDKNSRFDLIIIDGKDAAIQQLKRYLKPNGIMVIEGDRLKQLKQLKNLFPKHLYVHSISLTKNKRYSPFPEDEWQGGLKIIFVNPTFKQYCWWLKERILTKIKYQYPGRYLGGAIIK